MVHNRSSGTQDFAQEQKYVKLRLLIIFDEYLEKAHWEFRLSGQRQLFKSFSRKRREIKAEKCIFFLDI